MARHFDIDHLGQLEAPEPYYMGLMNQCCLYCAAFFWSAERNTKGKYTTCCGDGKVQLPNMTPPSDYIQTILQKQTQDGTLFYKKARAFNAKVLFASISLNEYSFAATHGV